MMTVDRGNNGFVQVRYGLGGQTETIKASEAISGGHYPGVFETEGGRVRWRYALAESTAVFGLGETVRGMNKRGYIYESFSTDDPVHTPGKRALYAAHNFFAVVGESGFSVYIDFPGKVIFDIGFENRDEIVVEVMGSDCDFYFFEGRLKETTEAFRALIGLSYTPPKWAFGYQQSRWSYPDESAVEAIADQFEAHDIPCDAIYLDIDYMERFKDFTIDKNAFPNFKAFVEKMKTRGIKLVPIIDAGVKVESGYSVYETGIQGGFFCTDAEGHPFEAAVWPGLVHFPDFMNPKARQWFGSCYHELLEQGIEGFWNDMNEPAIFYTPKGLQEAIDYVKAQEGENLDIYSFFEMKDKMAQISNAQRDYREMMHRIGEKKVSHYEVHNLYGYMMSRSADEGFRQFDANRRYLLIGRSSHIGMAKHAGIWTGDNQSWWEHLKLNIQMMPGLQMAGFLYAGADTGGFGDHTGADLMIRWMQFSLFTPLFRNHSAMGTRRQEPWAFDEKTLAVMRDIIRLRYAFVPYLYSEYMKANLGHQLLHAPLAYEYEGEDAVHTEDQLLFGESLMLAPIYEQNAIGRSVFVPERMAYLKLRRYEDLEKTAPKILSLGHHYTKAGLDEIPLFIRENHLFVLSEPASNIPAMTQSALTVIGFVTDRASYELLDDDGYSRAFERGGLKKTRFAVEKTSDGKYKTHVDTNDAGIGSVTFYIIDAEGKVSIIRQESPLYA
jgi:alpha-glucosidase